MSRTFFAYHLTHVFGPFGLDSYHTNSDKPVEGDLVYVLSGDVDGKALGVHYFLEGIFRIRRRNFGPWSMKGRSGENRSYKFRLSMEPVRRPDAPVSLSLAVWYSRPEVHRFFSSGQNFNPLPTDPDYKSRFDELLAGFGSTEGDDLMVDLSNLAREVPDETERDLLAKARIGQGKFRADVVSNWRKGEACALTGIDVPELLVASHIKPWRESSNEERLDPMNGVLLAAHVDKLFDRFLMSFEETRGEFITVIHPRVSKAVSMLGIRNRMVLNTSHLGLVNEGRFKRYMAQHARRYRDVVQLDEPTT